MHTNELLGLSNIILIVDQDIHDVIYVYNAQFNTWYMIHHATDAIHDTYSMHDADIWWRYMIQCMIQCMI